MTTILNFKSNSPTGARGPSQINQRGSFSPLPAHADLELPSGITAARLASSSIRREITWCCRASDGNRSRHFCHRSCASTSCPARSAFSASEANRLSTPECTSHLHAGQTKKPGATCIPHCEQVVDAGADCEEAPMSCTRNGRNHLGRQGRIHGIWPGDQHNHPPIDLPGLIQGNSDDKPTHEI